MSPARWLGAVAALLVVFGLAFGLRAGLGDLLGEPSLERQTRALSQQLRCPVCTGQSVAESDSTVANEMRAEIRQRLEAGEDPTDILDVFEARYGAWVINRPPSRGIFVLVWAGPFIAAGLGVLGIRRYVLRQRADLQSAAVVGRDSGSPDGGLPERDAGPADEVDERLKDYL